MNAQPSALHTFLFTVYPYLCLAVFLMVVTFERANLCVTQGLVGQPGCR